MQFKWEVEDIKPSGSGKSTMLGSVVENTGTTASNRFYLLGYRYLSGEQHITLTSLDDGLMIQSLSVEEMVDWMNNKGYIPHYPAGPSSRIIIKP